jgi:hypothetical protein
MDFFTSLLWAAEKVDPNLVANIGQKAADDAEIAARYALYSLIVQSVVPIATAWIAFKQVQLNRTMSHVEHNTNSIKDELVAQALQLGKTEGNLEGRAEQTAERQREKVSKGG